MALGSKILCSSVAFISPTAENALFEVARQFFDATFLLCRRVERWREVLDFLDNVHRVHSGNDKRRLASALIKGAGGEACEAVLSALRTFFADEIPATPILADLWKLEVVRAQQQRQLTEGIKYTSGQFERKGALRASLLGLGQLQAWLDAGLAKGSTALFDPRKLSKKALDEIRVGAEALEVHGLAKVMPALGNRLRVTEVPDEIVQALRKSGAQSLQRAIEAMVSAHPILESYIRDARDYGRALRMTKAFADVLASRSPQRHLEAALIACSQDANWREIESKRNWILDLMLLSSGLSQTQVQRQCSIGRLTHAATGQMTLSQSQAGEIVSLCMPYLPSAVEPADLAASLMKQRLYSLETHSYANPLYALIRSLLDELGATEPRRFKIAGYPVTNSAVVPTWHTMPRSSAGQIKVQFLVTDRKSKREMVIRVGSCHDGNVGNKRKEVAAKARVLSYQRADGTFRRASGRFLALVLDGEWEGSSEDPLRHVRMMHEAGWQLVLTPDTVEELRAAWSMHFRRDTQ